MTRSQLSSTLKTALNSLRLVEKGMGERSSIRKVLADDPSLRPFGTAGYNLLLGIVAERDLSDRVLKAAIQGRESAIHDLSLLRLAVYVLVKIGLSGEVMIALRENASERERSFLEYLFGFLGVTPLETLVDEGGDVERTALKTHNPPFWVKYCYHVFGRAQGLRILTIGHRPRYIRVNSLRNRGRVALPRTLKAQASELEAVDGVDGFFAIRGSLSRFAPHFETGLLQVQDLASFLSVSAGTPLKGERVLDLCAAPGGKTAALAQFMNNRGRILSVDLSHARLDSWRAETGRLGVRIAEPICADASHVPFHDSFNLVLVDPPCSGTGILDLNPQMKWRVSRSIVEKYSSLQAEILTEAGRLTGPGGRIVYSTCSLTLEENENIVSEFVANSPDFELVPCLEAFGSNSIGLRGCRRFYPYRDHTAGYFVARLERVS